MESLITDLLLPASMFAMMAAMGLTLTVADFQRTAEAPKATLLGIVLQLVAMPLAGLGLALFFELPPLLAAGLVIVAACPGGLFSNMYVHLARANTVLSITLTATATMVSLFTLPLWVRAVVDLGGFDDLGIDVPVLRTALELASFTVLPVLFGMWIRRRWPRSLRFEPPITRISALGIIGAIVFEASRRPDAPMDALLESLLPAGVLAISALLFGVFGPMLLRLPNRDAVTIGVELIVKNGLLGLVIARRSLDFEATLPILAFGVVQTPIGLLMLLSWWRREGRFVKRTETPPESV